MNKRGKVILIACIVTALAVSSIVLVFGVFNLGNQGVETGDFGLNFSLNSHGISVPQRGSTEVHFTVWLDSNITKDTNITLQYRLSNANLNPSDLIERQDIFNFTISPSSFSLQPAQSNTCILTITTGSQTPAGQYTVTIDSPTGEVLHIGNLSQAYVSLGYLKFNFEVAHAVPSKTASIDYWLDPTQTFSASGDSYLTAYCKNWGNVDGSFNLTVNLGNGVFKEKDLPSHYLLNSSTVVFPIMLHAGEQKNIDYHFSVNDAGSFNVSLSVSSSQQNLCVESRYLSTAIPYSQFQHTEYRSLKYELESGIWSSSVLNVL